jgi:hypothetical protein
MAGIRAVISTLMNNGRKVMRPDVLMWHYPNNDITSGCAQESWRDPQRLRDGSRHRRRPAVRIRSTDFAEWHVTFITVMNFVTCYPANGPPSRGEADKNSQAGRGAVR